MSVFLEEIPPSDLVSRTALQRVATLGGTDKYGGGDIRIFAEPFVDTVRVLSQAQTEFTLSDMEDLTWYYDGPPSGIEFLRLQHTNLAGSSDQDEKEKSAYHLATALSLYGKGSLQWENVIRKLVHEGVDIHGQVRCFNNEPWDDRDDRSAVLEHYGTPLDELFRHTDTPFEAQKVSRSWLRILASEGIDVLVYLEEEIALHTARHLLTWSTCLYFRKLIFQLDENPGVWWDWVIDPSSGAGLVREAFTTLSMNRVDCFDTYVVKYLEWDTWPWGYPDWCRMPWYGSGILELDYDGYCPERKGKNDLAKNRAARRMARKASKMRRALGIKRTSRVPGAWPL